MMGPLILSLVSHFGNAWTDLDFQTSLFHFDISQDEKVMVVPHGPDTRLFDLFYGKTIATIKTSSVAVCLSPCGKYLAMDGDGEKYLGTVQVWSIGEANPRQLAVLRQKTNRLSSDFSVIRDLRFSKDSKYLFALDLFPTLSVWEWGKGPKPVREIEMRDTMDITEAMFHGPDKLIACRKGRIEEYALDTKVGLEFLRSPDIEVERRKPLEHFAFSNNGKIVANWNLRDETAQLHVFAKNRSTLAQEVKYFRRLANGVEGLRFGKMAIPNDWSMVMIPYAKEYDHIYCAFFPLNEVGFEKLGLDAKEHSHVRVRLSKKKQDSPYPPWLLLSPSERWLVFRGFSEDGQKTKVWDFRKLNELFSHYETVKVKKEDPERKAIP